jgi:hypothetical protein
LSFRRIDRQKVRISIELGRSRKAIRADTLSNVVLVREDAPGDQRLVAYYVVRPGYVSFPIGEICAPAASYMVPQHFVGLVNSDNPNGKVDRKALPKPGGKNAENSYVAARTWTPNVAIWQGVLKQEPGGSDDFDGQCSLWRLFRYCLNRLLISAATKVI